MITRWAHSRLDDMLNLSNMPFDFSFDSTNQILGCSFTGRVLDDDFERMSLSTARYIALTRPRAGLSDTTDVTSWEVTPETLRNLAARPPGVPPLDRHRVVVAPYAGVFEMLRVFAHEAEITRPKLHVVRTMDEACAILGVQQFCFEAITEMAVRERD